MRAASSPMSLRVGGRSADAAYWEAPPPPDPPPWVFGVDGGWVEQLAALAYRDRFRVTLALNVAVHSPAMATSFARAVSGALGPGRLAGLAIGNEPDLFPHEPRFEAERIPTTLPSTPRDWTRGYRPSSYRRDYRAYARPLKRALPGVALVGPETTNLRRDWLRALSGLDELGPRSLTVHRYQFSSCWTTDSPFYPRISRLLDERASAGLARRLRPAIRYAHRDGLSLVVSELNSMSCGGTPGVADTFATALWAPDALFELVRAGVNGVNWHIRPQKINAPFEVLGTRIHALPELYGLALFARMVRPGARLVRAAIASRHGLHLKVWAVRAPGHEAVLMINKGQRTASVRVSGMRSARAARLERLSAPSVRARDRVTLGGRWIGADGRWHGPRVAALVRRHGDYRVRVPGYSAALLLH
jgi:hypothetical protein